MSRNEDALQMQIALQMQMQNADAECMMQIANAECIADANWHCKVADQKKQHVMSQTACAPEALGRIRNAMRPGTAVPPYHAWRTKFRQENGR